MTERGDDGQGRSGPGIRRLVGAFGAVLVVATTMIGVGAPPAGAQTDCANTTTTLYCMSKNELKVPSNQVPQGGSVSVGGTGFTPGTPVQVQGGATVLATTIANPQGAASVPVVIPPCTETGPLTLTATGQSASGGTQTQSAEVTVTGGECAHPSTASRHGVLPFTGAVIVPLVAVAAVLIGAGVVLARRGRRVRS